MEKKKKKKKKLAIEGHVAQDSKRIFHRLDLLLTLRPMSFNALYNELELFFVT